jgi:hypothetical protein
MRAVGATAADDPDGTWRERIDERGKRSTEHDEWNDVGCFDSTLLSRDICVVLRFMRAKYQ